MEKKKILFQFLKQPYPFYYKGKTYFSLLGLLFLMSLCFNYFFIPFNVYEPEHKMNYFLISLIHALVPSFLFLLFFVLSGFLPSSTTDKWSVGKEVFFLGMFLFLIGVGQFLIRDIIYDNPNNWSWQYFFEEIRNTFLVGILFVVILVPLNFSWLNYKNQKKANSLILQPTDSEKEAPIFIKTHLKSDDFFLETQKFIFAKAERNYVELFSFNGDTVDKMLKRISLKDLEKQLTSIPHIVKTHRSYMVNLKCVEHISGNAQGYILRLTHSGESIYVSRNMIQNFERSLNVI